MTVMESTSLCVAHPVCGQTIWDGGLSDVPAARGVAMTAGWVGWEPLRRVSRLGGIGESGGAGAAPDRLERAVDT